jgi:hypothetical protein
MDLSTLKKFYVSRDDESKAQNERHQQALHAVQEALTDHGLPATSGPQSAMPADTECKVLVHDRWFWDTYWYLLDLNIQLYDAHSGKLLAAARSRRAAPEFRRSPEFMANELVESLSPGSGQGTTH